MQRVEKAIETTLLFCLIFCLHHWLHYLSAELRIGNVGGLEVAGCRISVGARALAKHVPRSLDGWWGSITGTGMIVSMYVYMHLAVLSGQYLYIYMLSRRSFIWFAIQSSMRSYSFIRKFQQLLCCWDVAEAEKNKLAESTLHRLMTHTVWMNIHLAPIPLFEIRVSDGYGARWLADGSQVQYFLFVSCQPF